MLKAEARKIFAEKRLGLSEKDQQVGEDLLLIQFQKLDLPPLNTVMGYAAMASRNEISTDAILDFLLFRNPGMMLCFPVWNPKNSTLKAVLIEPETRFVINKQGIPEPNSAVTVDPIDLDLILVPLLCFDEKGYRVGYGKGVYDRFLANLRPDTITVGLSFFDPLPLIADTNNFDVPLDYCITPHKIYGF